VGTRPGSQLAVLIPQRQRATFNPPTSISGILQLTMSAITRLVPAAIVEPSVPWPVAISRSFTLHVPTCVDCEAALLAEATPD